MTKLAITLLFLFGCGDNLTAPVLDLDSSVTLVSGEEWSIAPDRFVGAGVIQAGTGPMPPFQGPVRWLSTGAGVAFQSVPMRVGDTIKAVSINIFGNGVVDLTMVEVAKINPIGGGILMGTVPISIVDVPRSWATHNVPILAAELAVGQSVLVIVGFNGAGLSLGPTTVKLERLGI